MQLRRLALLCSLLLVAACSFGGGNDTLDNGETAASSASSRGTVPETINVTYTGIVRPAGISIYQEGTHRLILADGRFVLLESSTVDLNGYVGEEAEVMGAVLPTVEEGGTIMRVDRIRLLEETNSSAATESQSSSTSAAASSVGVTSAAISSAAAASVTTVSSISRASSSLRPVSTSSSAGISAGLEQRIALMAADDLAPARWTQEYCTGHIGFCLPVHKNWWFKSFGTTTSQLWHVEISTEDILNIGDGPIAIQLLTGELTGATDGTVRIEGNQAISYRAWTEGRHFEIAADARLEAAVRYLTAQLRATELVNP